MCNKLSLPYAGVITCFMSCTAKITVLPDICASFTWHPACKKPLSNKGKCGPCPFYIYAPADQVTSSLRNGRAPASVIGWRMEEGRS
ncbi:hypothetical protein GQ44DRAFT_135945 [Phaeosphaeriaceae sp. PMI808]|nr:hypothetical protein GQ44DRAFT_135945 [Phaeosphaeriaceae sp. PMI808]